MAEPIIKEPVEVAKPIETPIDGGKVEKWPTPVASANEKAWGKLQSTVSGTYTLQMRLPDGTVQDLVTVAATVPVGSVAQIDARVYVNVVALPSEEP